MKTVRIIVESPDTGIVVRDLTVHANSGAREFRIAARQYPYHTVRKLGPEYAGCGNLEGRRVPAIPPRG